MNPKTKLSVVNALNWAIIILSLFTARTNNLLLGITLSLVVVPAHLLMITRWWSSDLYPRLLGIFKGEGVKNSAAWWTAKALVATMFYVGMLSTVEAYSFHAIKPTMLGEWWIIILLVNMFLLGASYLGKWQDRKMILD
jgi:hypothetical protein